MTHYQHILLAVDFFAQNDVVVERARDLAQRYQAKLSLIHVVDSLPIIDAGYGTDIPFNMDLTAELMASAKEKLARLANTLAIAEDCQWLELGNPDTEIVRIATENQVDLCVLGSHGRHGFALLLGSTANSVLHHAPCDVLAVRLPNDS